VKVAERDIVCYKTLFLRINSIGKIEMRSYWHDALYKMGKTYSKRSSSKFDELKEVHGEGFHSFVLKPDPTKINNLAAYKTNVVNVKCIIPKGTKFHYSYGERASQSIRVVGILHPKTNDLCEAYVLNGRIAFRKA
jgi:hypothetical protein